MSDLAGFLLARIAEDEAAEQEARRWSDRDWNVHGDSVFADHVEPILQHYSSDIVPTAGVLGHVARWDPARVRAECEAKRRILEQCEGWDAELDNTGALAATIMLALALPYADHPDYREEWRP